MKSNARALLAASCGLIALLATTTRAQNILVAEHKGALLPVRNVVHSEPYVLEGAKLVPASGRRFGLRPAPEYAPVYVVVRDVKVTTHAIDFIDMNKEMNQKFEFTGTFQSAFGLENVFVVLDMNSEDAGKVLFLYGIGRLEPNVARPVHLVVPMNQGVGGGNYRLHVFADGQEVFHSNMPMAYVEHALDKMVRSRIAGVTDAPIKPFTGPAPVVPKSLDKTDGQAVIRFTVSPTGRVQSPSIVSATQPEFGEVALAAAQQWRFLPRVKGGVPVSTVTQMPFVFRANAAAAAP